MQILFQILTAIMIVLAIFQKQKWKMMLYYTICNIFCVIMYLTFGRTAAACISVVATARTFVFMIYSYKKIKPNIVWLVVFETAFVIATILTWNDALDLMPLIAILAAGYGSWQDNITILRSSYIINETLNVIYKMIIGAYISMAVDSISLMCTLISFVYYCILKKETPILEAIFKKRQSLEKESENIKTKNEELENKDNQNTSI